MVLGFVSGLEYGATGLRRVCNFLVFRALGDPQEVLLERVELRREQRLLEGRKRREGGPRRQRTTFPSGMTRQKRLLRVNVARNTTRKSISLCAELDS